MSEKREPLSHRHRRFGLLQPLSWILFWWMMFHFLETPAWVPVAVYTVLVMAWAAVVVHYFGGKPRELVFKEDGKVEWKYEG